tara:strand:- start:981 stop:1205 length:225 start_codon:yes stop_codon:yes gene_type:complete
MNNNTSSSRKINVDAKMLQKMIFIYNSLQDGWNVIKKNDNYIFKKKHEGKKEILNDTFLSTFIKQNSKIEINLE